jgi:hypothetical protein
MAEATQYVFNFKELTEILIKKQGIHEGLWGILIKFGLQAGNLNTPGTETVLPTAIVPVLEIGIQKQDQPNPLAVDAAAVNPRPPSDKKSS